MTPRQSEILAYIVSYVAGHGVVAPWRSIANRFGFSVGAVTGHLRLLEAHGKIQRFKGGYRLVDCEDREAARAALKALGFSQTVYGEI